MEDEKPWASIYHIPYPGETPANVEANSAACRDWWREKVMEPLPYVPSDDEKKLYGDFVAEMHKREMAGAGTGTGTDTLPQRFQLQHKSRVQDVKHITCLVL